MPNAHLAPLLTPGKSSLLRPQFPHVFKGELVPSSPKQFPGEEQPTYGEWGGQGSPPSLVPAATKEDAN